MLWHCRFHIEAKNNNKKKKIQTGLTDLNWGGRKRMSQKKLIGWFSPCGEPWEDMFKVSVH